VKTNSKILIYQSPTGRQDITMHLKNIYKEGELDEKATCKDYLQVQTRATA